MIHFMVMEVDRESFFKAIDIKVPYAGYLMKHIGTVAELNNFKDILRSLNKLHKLKLCHGDSRFQNVVCVNGNYKWIDFRNSFIDASSFTYRNEIYVFLRSCQKHFNDDILQTYGDDLDIEKVLSCL